MAASAVHPIPPGASRNEPSRPYVAGSFLNLTRRVSLQVIKETFPEAAEPILPEAVEGRGSW